MYLWYYMEEYISYLLNKYLIFNCNKVDDNYKIGDELCYKLCNELCNDLGKKNIKKDINFIELTKKILVNFVCFRIDLYINIDSRIKESEAEKIFYHYKKYKSSDIRETETYLNLDNTLDTLKTEWVESIDISTNDLVDKYGDYSRTGNHEDNHRFEYKFEFIEKGKKWVFSVYDYLNTDDLFDDLDDIRWHVASNTKKGDIIKKFIEMLKEKSCC
jgi:hypothetical protein